jgi:hypothetical protein
MYLSIDVTAFRIYKMPNRLNLTNIEIWDYFILSILFPVFSSFDKSAFS